MKPLETVKRLLKWAAQVVVGGYLLLCLLAFIGRLVGSMFGN